MTNINCDFTAPTALPLFTRTYSRYKKDGTKESPKEAKDRAINGLRKFGLLTEDELNLIEKYFYANQVFVSGRWFWVGGTEWVEQPKNYIGAYNCASVPVTDWEAFRFNFRALLMGCGVGTGVELFNISQLSKIKYPINLEVIGELGSKYVKGDKTYENSVFFLNSDSEDTLEIQYIIGDSKEGWVDVMTHLLEFSSMSAKEIVQKYRPNFDKNVEIKDYKSVSLKLDPTYIRPKGETLEGFGGKSNPETLIPGLQAITEILNGAVGRQLNSLEVILITDWAGAVAVSGNIRRSAKLQQGSAEDEIFTNSKDNLWVQDEKGNWKIDVKRDVLRLSNHTCVYHSKPDLWTITTAVQNQYYSGEGAIQYAPEAIARCNVDLLDTPERKQEFINLYCENQSYGAVYLQALAVNKKVALSDKELEHRLQRYYSNPCFEVLGKKFLCNLSQVHLNNLDPQDYKQQEQAFRASTLAALPLLSHVFDIEDFRYSREIDPIIGISFTGLFDFFVNAFGKDWLEWWKTGRSKDYKKAQYFLKSERDYLELWKDSVKNTIEEYCKRHNIRQPNRYTLTQPSGSVSLLTNASPGWHPPKATRYIRRITYSKDSPLVQACIDYGYKVIPSQSCKDEYGNLLDDINDSRVNEVLVEIPIEVSWANIADEADFNPKDIDVLAQLDFYMQVQNFYATHTVSATLELSEHEIEPLGHAIHDLIQNDKGYISVALLAKFDSLETFPRLPFEPISYEEYLAELIEIQERRISDDFMALVNKYTTGDSDEQGPSGCDSDKCLLPEKR